ncbi:MAG TPA: ABC transporter substrate-binding protein [Methylomusa anaerophila]|uniref:NMT1/THI5 like protein n=1 Tax=Methylomusa anaerophila TaxID=1930071 RepID=A0A348AEM1_9FIRM|nr:ABC transporter substrate-binding protein [Methylomusa anaerophila]BBB89519.1 NMT1/THI5 like protein [Methylomusa anaerophila]HML90111.1 ABC transporter substrate-binding protein [Methylomusa anaerophila]
MKITTAVRRIMAALLALALVFAVGCSKEQKKDTATAGDGKKYDVIRVPTPVADATSTVLYWVGEELGYFAEQGIKLEYVGQVPSGQLVASVVAGKIDVGGAHVNRTIAGISAGAKIKAVVAQSETTEEIPHHTYITLKDSPVKGPQDMVGKKIGIATYGGCNEYIPYGYMRTGGIKDPRGKIEIIIMPDTLMEQALRQGEVDVAGFSRQLPAELRQSKEFNYLFSDFEPWGTKAGGTPLYFTEKFIKEKPDVVRRFVTAMAKTINWQNANMQKATEITAKRANVDPKQIKPRYFAPDGIITEESVTVWIDLLTEFGEIKPGIKPDQIYTNEFNPFAKK